MYRFSPALVAFALAAHLTACAASPAPVAPSAPAKASSFDWPPPAGWKTETIPFPLDFAPGLPYRGTEELRFAPGFFDPNAAGYWSYAFAWFVEPGAPFTASVLETQLHDYFAGLTKAVASDAKDHWQPSLDRIEAHIAAVGPTRFEGTLRTIDAFKTRAEVNLVVHALSGTCGDHAYLLVSASPKPAGDAMWASLDQVTSAFRCR